MENTKELTTRNSLAIERTKLANERTFLAYFRTVIILLASGLSIYKIELLHEIKFLGIGFIILSPILFAFGLIRFIIMRNKINKL